MIDSSEIQADTNKGRKCWGKYFSCHILAVSARRLGQRRDADEVAQAVPEQLLREGGGKRREGERERGKREREKGE